MANPEQARKALEALARLKAAKIEKARRPGLRRPAVSSPAEEIKKAKERVLANLTELRNNGNSPKLDFAGSARILADLQKILRNSERNPEGSGPESAMQIVRVLSLPASFEPVIEQLMQNLKKI